MGRVDDLIAFMRARLDKDEATARTATDGPWHPDGMSVRGKDRDYHGGREDAILVIRHTWPQEAAHICRHDPASALRDVVADRKLIAAYLAARADVPPVDAWYEVADGVKVGVADGLKAAVKIRAERFSGHPDYRVEWRP